MAKNPPIKGVPVALVGGESLLGKDLRDLLETQASPAHIRLIAGAEEGSVLTEQAGELAVMLPLQADAIASARIVLLAGSPESSRKAYQMSAGKDLVYIDLTRGLEDNPLARLRAPYIETSPAARTPIQVVAHPAAIALALFLRRLQSLCPIRRSVALVFEPASERGQAGLDELQQQTVGLLSFQKLKKNVFDAQVSFNLLPRFGDDAPLSLEDIESTIERHLASLLSTVGNVPMPSLRLVQAPVFHGYSFSLWVEFEQSPDLTAIADGLGGPKIEVRSKEHEAPANAGVAGQSGITVGALAPDRNNARAAWFWMVADNLRIAAENAVEVALELLV